MTASGHRSQRIGRRSSLALALSGSWFGIAGADAKLSHQSSPYLRAVSPLRAQRHEGSLMGYGKLILILAGLPVGALAGALLGLDAHANEWSRRPVLLFSAVGAIVVAAVMVYVVRM